jgi:3-oxoacyl-[acyl-carrier protein] reductase
VNNILIVGANSFIAKNAIEKLRNSSYKCITTSRNNIDKTLVLDIEDEKSIKDFCSRNSELLINGILFFQGINPSKNTLEMTSTHFLKMCLVNLIGPLLLIKHFHKNIDKNGMVLFMSSIASKKGSYDPSYAAAKSGIKGLVQSLAKEFPDLRFNTISLGLVEDSPVFNNMTPDFRKRHAEKMNNKFVNANDVSTMIVELLQNTSINKTTVNIDRGFSL